MPIALPRAAAAALALALAALPAGAQVPAVLALRPPAEAEAGAPILSRGLLTREVLRQAVLLAGREEFGLATRDGSLGEPPRGGPGDLDLTFTYTTGTGVRVALVRPGNPPAEFGNFNLALPGNTTPDLSSLSRDAEGFSRTGLGDGLRKAGLAGKPNRRLDAAPVEAAVTDRLERMSFAEQFAAARELHTLLRESGESPERLGALVRAYANLGLLTEHLWHPAHKAFKARALLYAQRLAARGATPAALFHRAYALAAAGDHPAAARDLAAARAAAAKAGGVPEPAWAPLLEAYLAYRPGPLEEAAGDPHLGPLALLLRLMVVEHPNATQYTLQAALAVLKTNPECERAHEARCEVGGVANLHAATVEAPREFARALPALLRAMPALPEKVGARLDAGLADTGLADALTEAAAGDRREPSWAALGLLVRETQFLHDARRLLFMRDSWSVPTEEAAAEALKRVPADHPYRPFIASFALSPRSPEYARALRSIAPRLPEPTIYPLIVKLVQLDPNQPVVDRALAHCDLIARDLTQAVHLVAGPSKPKYARPLLKLCPHAPSAQAALVRFDWPAAAGQAAEWEADGHPAVLRALGERHAGQNRLADAERCLRKASDLSPDRPTYRLLAQVYRGRGDLERWKATLEGFLTQEDAGLDHAQVRVELARYHMARGEWDRATPYAEAAAETYAEWALRCASECAEGAGDLAKSEQWITRAAERYPGSAVEWFYWCSRTGRGDIAAARRAAAAYARGLGERPNRGDIFGVAVFHLANGDPAAALELMDRPSSRGALIFSLYVAALADAGGKADLRDERLKPDAARPDAVGRYATLLRKVTEGGAEPTVKELDAAVAALPESQRQAMLYPVGVMLYTHGRQKEGLAYLERLATAPGNESVYRTVAVAALRERGAEPGKYPAAKP